MMSKDGDWILREDAETTNHVLGVLEAHGARYRFGAPLDVRWLRGGWSSHFEFDDDGVRVRTDFVTRPPRLSPEDLQALWQEQEGQDLPVVDVRRLIVLKQTNREKDYAVIGELARRLEDPAARLLASRSARDLLELAAAHPALARRLARERPVLASLDAGREMVERALDAERRAMMRANEERLQRYLDAGAAWAKRYRDVARATRGRPLPEVHAAMCEAADGVLPVHALEEDSGA